jgi:hypothetical protein
MHIRNSDWIGLVAGQRGHVKHILSTLQSEVDHRPIWIAGRDQFGASNAEARRKERSVD